MMDCLVTREDLSSAVADVLTSMGNSDHSDEEDSDETDSPSSAAEEPTNDDTLSPE